MLTDIPTKEIFKDLDGVEMKVKLIERKQETQPNTCPSGKNANDVRSYIKEYEIKTNSKVDVLLVDYLDPMMPKQQKSFQVICLSKINLFPKNCVIWQWN